MARRSSCAGCSSNFCSKLVSEYRKSRNEPAPTITGWRVDRPAYAVVPLLSDGSEGAPLELRGLFEQFYNEVTPSTASR